MVKPIKCYRDNVKENEKLENVVRLAHWEIIEKNRRETERFWYMGTYFTRKFYTFSAFLSEHMLDNLLSPYLLQSTRNVTGKVFISHVTQPRLCLPLRAGQQLLINSPTIRGVTDFLSLTPAITIFLFCLLLEPNFYK